MDKIINLLVSINNNHFRRYLFVLLPLLTVLISLYNIVDFLPENQFYASGSIVVIIMAAYFSILYWVSHRRDLFCMTSLMIFFLCSIFNFIANRVYAFINVLMLTLLIAVFIITMFVRFSPRRYG